MIILLVGTTGVHHTLVAAHLTSKTYPQGNLPNLMATVTSLLNAPVFL